MAHFERKVPIMIFCLWLIASKKPISLNIDNPQTGNQFDIIIRDAETLAYDVEKALEGGTGTLLHIGSHNRVLCDPHHVAQTTRNAMKTIHALGPYPVYREDLVRHCQKIRLNIGGISKLQNKEARDFGVLCLTHDIGVTALRARRTWVGKGKILGRFLYDHLPDIKLQLETASANALRGDFKCMRAVLDSVEKLTPLSFGGEKTCAVRDVLS